MGNDGVSAVEFALVAPVLVLALVSSTDIGLAEYQHMTIGHILRAGAQSAMSDPGQAQVLSTLQNTATKNFTLGTGGSVSSSALTVNVVRFCACAAAPDTSVACSTTCSGSVATEIFYTLSASIVYRGMVMPSMTFAPVLKVQVR